MCVGVAVCQAVDRQLHCVECAAHCSRKMHVQYVVAVFVVRLEVAHVVVWADCASLRQSACTQFVVKCVGVELVKVLVGAHRHTVDHIRHTD